MKIGKFRRQELLPGLQFSPSDTHRGRLRFIFPFFVVAFLLITMRLIQIQVKPNENLVKESEVHEGLMLLDYPRGQIIDRNTLVLATDIAVPSLYVDPRLIKDDMALVNHLSLRLGIPEDQILPCLMRKSPKGVIREAYPIKRWITDIPEEELKEIAAFGKEEDEEGSKKNKKLPLHIEYEPLRNYPHGESAAHLLGSVDRDGDAILGLELTFDEYLRCDHGEIHARKTGNKKLLPSRIIDYKEAEGGDTVQLTLDVNMQRSLENALDRRMEEVGSKAALGMLMDPKTGAIFALATRPAFDPNKYRSYKLEELNELRDRVTKNYFEPGSAFKIVVAAAAIEGGYITPDEMVDCQYGTITVGRHTISDYYKNLGVIPFSMAFAKSSNVGMIKQALKMGFPEFERWLRNFGFCQKTSRQLPAESPGYFSPHERKSDLRLANVAIGQGIAVTVPQLARAFAAIANGGLLVEPYFIEKAENRDREITYQYVPPEAKRIMKPETAQIMKELCFGVVDHGTAKSASIPEYRSGGKTGTAQIAGVGGYQAGRYNAVFAGFAPIADPRIVAVIVMEEPSGDRRTGGYVCSPVFQEVVRDALIRLNVPEDPMINPDSKEEPAPPLLVRKSISAQQRLEDQMMLQEQDMVTDADTVAFVPAPENMDANLGALIASVDGNAVRPGLAIDANSVRAIPDMTGKTKSEARECLQKLGAVMDAEGAGWVTNQDLPPGTVVEVGTVCGVTFGGKTAEEPADDTG